jgi:hypothetical protein
MLTSLLVLLSFAYTVTSSTSTSFSRGIAAVDSPLFGIHRGGGLFGGKGDEKEA